MLQRSDAVDEMKKVFAVLEADVDAALAEGRREDTPYAQRALVRAHFAAVEGLSFQLRQVTIATLQGTSLLTPIELALLKEETYSINEAGRPRASEKFLKFPESFLFSMRCYAKNHGAEFDVDTGGAGWQAMREANAVRNRVTHPKSLESLTLTEGDLTALVNAAEWSRATLLELFKKCEEADEYWRRRQSAETEPDVPSRNR